jgi:hypothetical protein
MLFIILPHDFNISTLGRDALDLARAAGFHSGPSASRPPTSVPLPDDRGAASEPGRDGTTPSAPVSPTAGPTPPPRPPSCPRR